MRRGRFQARLLSPDLVASRVRFWMAVQAYSVDPQTGFGYSRTEWLYRPKPGRV